MQDEQLDWIGRDVNLPAAQLVHSLDEASEYFPAKQVKQLDDEVAPVVARYLPTAQLKHVDELMLDW